MYIELPTEDQYTVQRKVRMLLKLPHEDVFRGCINVEHARSLLKACDIFLSKHDIYNWLNPKRGKKRLSKRIPAGLTMRRP